MTRQIKQASPPFIGYAGPQTVAVVANDRRARRAETAVKGYATLLIASLSVSLLETAGLWPNSGGLLSAPLFLVSRLIVLSCVVFGVLSVVFYLMWQHRAAWNVRAAGRRTTDSPAWGVGYWFIPIANLFVPRRVLGDLWRAAGAGGRPGVADELPMVVFLLWATFNGLHLLEWTIDAFLTFGGTGVGTGDVRGLAAVTVGLGATAGVLKVTFWWLLAVYVRAVQQCQDACEPRG